MGKKWLTTELKERYVLHHSGNGEEECKIYTRVTEKGRKVSEVANDVGMDISTAYRIVSKVEKFIKDENNLLDYNKLFYIKPYNAITISKTNLSTHLAILCLATYCTYGKQEISKMEINIIEREHRSIKNNRKRLEKEIQDTYWSMIGEIKSMKVFEYVEYNLNGIKFELSEEVKTFLDNTK